MLKECFIKAINYKDFEDVTDVDNEVKEFLENESVLMPALAFVVSTNEFGVGDKMGQGPFRCPERKFGIFSPPNNSSALWSHCHMLRS